MRCKGGGLATAEIEKETMLVDAQAGADDAGGNSEAVHGANHKGIFTINHELIRVDSSTESLFGFSQNSSRVHEPTINQGGGWGPPWSRRGRTGPPP